MIQNLRALLAPTGRLRVGINMANFLLVTGQRPDGTPDGVSPDLARQIAHKLDVTCDFIFVEEWLVVERLAQRGRGHGCLGDDGRRVIHHQLLVLVVHQGRAVLREQSQRHAILQSAVGLFRADGRVPTGTRHRT